MSRKNALFIHSFSVVSTWQNPPQLIWFDGVSTRSQSNFNIHIKSSWKFHDMISSKILQAMKVALTFPTALPTPRRDVRTSLHFASTGRSCECFASAFWRHDVGAVPPRSIAGKHCCAPRWINTRITLRKFIEPVTTTLLLLFRFSF